MAKQVAPEGAIPKVDVTNRPDNPSQRSLPPANTEREAVSFRGEQPPAGHAYIYRLVAQINSQYVEASQQTTEKLSEAGEIRFEGLTPGTRYSVWRGEFDAQDQLIPAGDEKPYRRFTTNSEDSERELAEEEERQAEAAQDVANAALASATQKVAAAKK